VLLSLACRLVRLWVPRILSLPLIWIFVSACPHSLGSAAGCFAPGREGAST
jgi:hypothetical protein